MLLSVLETKTLEWGKSTFHQFCYSVQNELCVMKIDYTGVFFTDDGKGKGKSEKYSVNKCSRVAG